MNPPDRLAVVTAGADVLLRNLSAVDALRVVYATSASLWGFPGPDDVTTTSRVTFEVLDLPAGHDVLIETVDPFEEGHVSYTLVEAEWADGHSDGEGHRTLPQTTDPDPGGLGRLSAVAAALQSGHPVPPPPVGPPRVVREVRRTGSTPGRVRRGLLASPPTPRTR